MEDWPKLAYFEEFLLNKTQKILDFLWRAFEVLNREAIYRDTVYIQSHTNLKHLSNSSVIIIGTTPSKAYPSQCHIALRVSGFHLFVVHPRVATVSIHDEANMSWDRSWSEYLY